METVYIVIAATEPTRTDPEGTFAGSAYILDEAGLDSLPDGTFAVYEAEREDITKPPVIKTKKAEERVRPHQVIERKTPKQPATRTKEIDV